MDNTLSVSKGCFVFNNNTTITRKSKKITKTTKKVVCKDPWYVAYKKSWNRVEEKLKSLHDDRFSEVLHNLIGYVKSSYTNDSETYAQDAIVPTAALLTGINMPDHGDLFSTLVRGLHEEVTPHVAVLKAQTCGSVRTTVEQMAAQFMNTTLDGDENSDGDDDDIVEKVKKTRCNFPALSAWYKSLKSPQKSPETSPRKRKKMTASEVERQVKKEGKKLLVVIPDFENFSPTVLQDFILIVSGYTKTLPLVLVLGVATTVAALHRSLPYHVSARMCIQLFQAPPSVKLLNQVLEQVIFDPACTFHLGSKTFKFLMDVFLFYDFSVKGFIQGFKFCMMEHFCGQDWKMLCCPASELKANIAALDEDDMQQLRNMPSFQQYLDEQEWVEERTALLNDDKLFKHTLLQLLLALHEHLDVFHMALGCLNALTAGLPKNPLGTQIRELYGMAASVPIVRSPEFRESFQLLGFQSRDELLARLEAMSRVLESSARQLSGALVAFERKLDKFRSRIRNVGLTSASSPRASPKKLDVSVTGKMNRYQFKDKLLELSRQCKPLSPFEVARKELLDYLAEEAFPQLLSPPASMPMAELLFFDKVSSVRTHIVGAPRAAIHTALCDPQFYLECKCCKQPHEGSLLPSMPDVSIAYKLYLECGRFINLYDWLQAFVAVVKPGQPDDDQRKVDPCIHARFTRAVAELQFLGFVKSSNRKTDHVTKLT